MLVVGWVEEHEVGRLLGEDEEQENSARRALPTSAPIWEDEDVLVKQKEEEFEFAV